MITFCVSKSYFVLIPSIFQIEYFQLPYVICNTNKTGLPCLVLKKLLVLRKTDDAQNMMSIAVSEYVLVLSSDSHSTIPMLGDWSQYGITILMTDERASQVSHSSWRTKASHNKSRLIPGPWAPPQGRQCVEFSSQSHVITVESFTLLHCQSKVVRLCCFSPLNLRKPKVFSSFYSALP